MVSQFAFAPSPQPSPSRRVIRIVSQTPRRSVRPLTRPFDRLRATLSLQGRG